MSAVYKTKLRPRYIGPFTVVTKKGLACTLNLLRKLQTHPVFYVSLVKPYHDPLVVNHETLVPQTEALPPSGASTSSQIALSNGAGGT